MVGEAYVIFIEAFGFELAMEDLEKLEYQPLSAVRQRNLHRVLPNNYYGVNFATELVNSYYIGSVFYPDRFSDVDIKQKADEIYEMFVGERVYDQMKEVWGDLQKVQ